MGTSLRSAVAFTYVVLTVGYVFAAGRAFAYPPWSVEVAFFVLGGVAVGVLVGSWWALALPAAVCLLISLILMLLGSSEDVSNIWVYWALAVVPMFCVAVGVMLGHRTS